MFDASLPTRRVDDALASPPTRTMRAEAFLRAPPSGKIRYAIDDLEAAERSRLYEVDMDTWHAPAGDDNRCYVCFAGAVLANRHAIQPHQTYVGPFVADGPNEYSIDERWDDQFNALDEFRTGYVEAFLTMEGTLGDAQIAAFAKAHSPADPHGCFPGHVDYEDSPARFKAWARGVADELAAAGA